MDMEACNFFAEATNQDSTCFYGFVFCIDMDTDDLGDPAFSYSDCDETEPNPGFVANCDDLCPDDTTNDTDEDGICDGVDTCVNDAENDIDEDGQCGDVDPCPYDADDDLDQDGLCADVDPCPSDVENDADEDGVCETNEVFGCPVEEACNYNAEVTEDDGSCWYTTDECSCEDGLGAVADMCDVCDTDFENDCVQDCFGVWGGEGIYDDCGICNGNNETMDACGICFGDGSICSEIGCMDEDACNYNSNALEDDGSCSYAVENFDCNGLCVVDIDCNGICGGELELDCAGVCGGLAVFDACGLCALGTTGIEPNVLDSIPSNIYNGANVIANGGFPVVIQAPEEWMETDYVTVLASTYVLTQDIHYTSISLPVIRVMNILR
jgi:hypothetical protein